jgi:hypothetical protein
MLFNPYIGIDPIHAGAGGPDDDPVGFEEVRVASNDAYATPLRVRELVRMPSDLLRALGSKSLDHPLALVVSRDPMDDTAMDRQIWLPVARTFQVGGTVRLGAAASDTELDRVLGIADASEGGVTATSDGRYRDTITRASSAIDDDSSTAWTTPLGKPTGSMQIVVPRKISFDHLDLQIVDDGRHSVPTGLQIDSDTDARRVIDLEALPHQRGPDGTVSIPVTFDQVDGRRFTFTITGVDPVVTKAFGPAGTVLPSGIAELGIPGVHRAPMQERLSDRCFDDLLTVDGQPFPVRLDGSTADALQGQPLALEPCDDDTITLSAGEHELAAGESPNSPSGVDVQTLLLTSGEGGEAAPPTAIATEEPGTTGSQSPAVRIVKQSRTSMTLEAAPASEPYWLVLGQSINRGWVAKANGHDLGRPVLVDGFANGWRIDPADGEATTITLNWAPQRGVHLALLISALAILACFAIVVATWLVRRRRRSGDAAADRAAPRWSNPLENVALPYRRAAVIGTVATAAVLGSLLIKWWVGPFLAAFVFMAIRDPRWRTALRLAPGGILLVTALFVTLAQVVRDHPAVFHWPQNFDFATVPVWSAVVLLGIDAVISCLWQADEEPARDPEAGSSRLSSDARG